MGTVRFLLALSVVVTHAPGSTVFGHYLFPGITAVQCFYVISGFLITMVLNEREEYENLGNFYLSRYLRLWPTYFVVTVATLVLFQSRQMFSVLPAATGWGEASFIWFSNLTLFGQDWLHFVRLDEGHFRPAAAFGTWPAPQPYQFLLVPQAWTLGVEMTFYAIAPFICRRWWGVALLFVFGVVSRLIVAHYNVIPNDPWIYRFAPSEMMMFAGGGLAYFCGRHICPRFPTGTKIVCALCLTTFVALIFADRIIQPIFGQRIGYTNMTLLIGYFPAIIFMFFAAAPLFYGTRNSAIDREIGELSYPMYISHVFFVHAMAAWVPVSWQAGNVAYVVAVIATSAALVVMVIKPVDRHFRRKLGARTDSLVSALEDVEVEHGRLVRGAAAR